MRVKFYKLGFLQCSMCENSSNRRSVVKKPWTRQTNSLEMILLLDANRVQAFFHRHCVHQKWRFSMPYTFRHFFFSLLFLVFGWIWKLYGMLSRDEVPRMAIPKGWPKKGTCGAITWCGLAVKGSSSLS